MKQILLFLLLISSYLSAQVTFDADFESGNLASVTTDDSVHYSVRSNEDIGGRWFYFRISGVKDKYIEVTIENSDVRRPFYSYDNIDFQRFTAAESPSTNFFKKEFEQDTVWVSYYNPYTYSHLQDKISEWKESAYVQVDTIGFAAHDFPMQEVRITDTTVPDEGKQRVWIHARTHPGETPSSFHFEGIVEELLKNSVVSQYYRENIIFYMFPFVNPEGVYYGRSRTNYDYVDLERDWAKPESNTTDEVKALKARWDEINAEKELSVLLNLHSIASPACTFYIHTAESTNDYFYRRQYQFCYLNTSDNPYFKPSDFNESTLREYYPEGYTWDNNGDATVAITYETPYDRYSSGEWVTNESLLYIGERTLYAVAEFLELSQPQWIVLDNKDASLTGSYDESSEGLRFYSDNYYLLPEGDGNVTAQYSTGEVMAGRYDVYAWWPEDGSHSYQTEIEVSGDGSSDTYQKTQRQNGAQWNYLGEKVMEDAGNITINVFNNNTGLVAADAFRIILREPITSVKEDPVPGSFKLYPNYPNPFNPSTTIRFELFGQQDVKIKVYNPLGQLVAVLADKNYGAGTHEVVFNAADYGSLSSGVYYYNITAGKNSVTKGMVLVK